MILSTILIPISGDLNFEFDYDGVTDNLGIEVVAIDLPTPENIDIVQDPPNQANQQSIDPPETHRPVQRFLWSV